MEWPDDEITVSLDEYYYGQLKERGSTGTRYGGMGWKIDITDYSRVTDSLEKLHVENILEALTK